MRKLATETTLLLLGLLIFFVGEIWSYGIVNNSGTSPEDSVTVNVLCPDSLSCPVKCDSFYVVVFKSGTNLVVFRDSGLITMTGMDSTVIGGRTAYYYHRATADIDGDGLAGQYSGQVISVTATADIPFVSPFTFQVASKELDDVFALVDAHLDDSTAEVKRLVYLSLDDSLALVKNLIQALIDDSLGAVKNKIYSYLDAAITSRSTLVASDNIGINWGDVSNPTTSLNLSGTTISTSQGVASVSGDVTIADAESTVFRGFVWNGLTSSHTKSGSFGDYSDWMWNILVDSLFDASGDSIRGYLATHDSTFLTGLVYFWGACDDCYQRMYPDDGSLNKDSVIVIDPNLSGADTLAGKVQFKHKETPSVVDTSYFDLGPWW